ncbi:hypothetical protein [Haloprofundus sp. MHR1]|uniref:hypothetical protein n=1 Tax=Haloprofundus sp. MHR1 TaxID=2572921 RepID=UPI0010BE45DC|nr:hypothetical protein [Haloprofundus sp. MHR1]QCJ48120.1 hypothetical protein FCF25_13745 [Haloprofundus sp. MHR1]
MAPVVASFEWRTPAEFALQLGPVDALISTFGPFVVPVLIFAVGTVGYLILVALGRAGLVSGDER